MSEKTRKISLDLRDIDYKINGTKASASFEEVPPEPVSLSYRLYTALSGTWGASSDPTQTMTTNLSILQEELPAISQKLEEIKITLETIETQLDELKAPYTPGRFIKM